MPAFTNEATLGAEGVDADGVDAEAVDAEAVDAERVDDAVDCIFAAESAAELYARRNKRETVARIITANSVWYRGLAISTEKCIT